MTIGERIKARREALEMSQEELAHKIGYKSKTSINKIELGIQELRQSKIKQIADALQTTPAYIMGWKETEDQQLKKCRELFKKCHGSDAYDVVSLYLTLDESDKNVVKTMIESLLSAEKYSVKKESLNA